KNVPSASLRPDRRRSDGVPPGIAGLSVIARQRIPVRPRDAVQIEDDLSIAQRELARQLLRAAQACAVHVGEAEAPGLEPKDRDVARRSASPLAQLFALDLARRIPR